LVQKSGSFFSYGDERIGQGRGNAKAYLRENPAMTKELGEKIYTALGVEPAPSGGIVAVPAPANGGPPEAEAEAAAEAA
jgi:recombination protein RecA